MKFRLGNLAKKSTTPSSGAVTSRDLANLLGGVGTRAGVSVNEKTALQTAAALCAARVLAEGVSQLPVKVYRDVERDGQWHHAEARDHWAWGLLRDAPNDWMTAFEFHEFLMYHAIFAGNAFAIKNKGAATGRVKELLPVLSSSVTIDVVDWEPVYTIRDKRGVIGRYAKGDILHLRGPSWDGFRGLPMVKLARETLGLSDALQNSQAALQAAGGRPSGILSTEASVSPEARSRLKESWDEKFGAGGEGGVAILDGSWKFISTTMTSVDSQQLESRRFQIEEACRFFRVFPQMLMQADKASTYASAEQFFLAHVIHSLEPWLCRLEGVYQRDLVSGETGVRVEFIRDGLLRGASKDRAEFFSKALGAGGSPAWMTPNEVRAKQNLNPKPGGDELPKPVAMMGNSAGQPAAKEGTETDE